ncbi:MAG: NUDIX domain-containing protein [Acidimicrobiales bacterium]
MTTLRSPYPAWIYRQSGVVPYRWKDQDLEVLIISSRGGKRWVVPKGIVEPGMSPAASAAKEAREEAGVDGEVGETSLGSYRYRKWGGTCEVDVYPLRVRDELTEWPERNVRRRRWLPARKAARKVDQQKLRKIIADLPELVGPEGEPGAPRPPDEAIEAPRLVYLFRHAKSSWSDPQLDDFDRPLNPRGERACDAMGEYFRLADIHPGLVVCSAALRTRQTLERVLPAIGEDTSVKYYRGLYLTGPQAMLDRLRRTPADVRRVMLVAHNPGMQTLAKSLAGEGPGQDLARLAEKLPTGALAILLFRGRSWEELREGSCELHSLVAPRDLDVTRPT